MLYLKYKMVKKGQITIFMILGIFIVLVIAFFLYLGFKVQGSSLNNYSPDQADDIEDRIRSCITSFAEDGLIRIGNQGGYIDLPQDFFTADYGSIAYSYSGGNVILRSLREIENDLENFIDSNLMECSDFESFQKAKITAKKPMTRISLMQEKVELSTVFHVLVEYNNGQVITIKEPFVYRFDVRYGYLYNEVKNILDKKASDSFVETFLDLERKNDYKLTFFEYEGGKKQVYVLFDPLSHLRGKKYKFVTALSL